MIASLWCRSFAETHDAVVKGDQVDCKDRKKVVYVPRKAGTSRSVVNEDEMLKRIQSLP